MKQLPWSRLFGLYHLRSFHLSSTPKYICLSSTLNTKMDVSSAMKADIQSALQAAIGIKNTSALSIEKMSRKLCAFYCELSEEERNHFLITLAKDFNVNHQIVCQLAKNLVDNSDRLIPLAALKLEERLLTVLTPTYHWLFSQIGRLENGVKFLVDMRNDIIRIFESGEGETTELSYLKSMSGTLKDLLTLWFSVGFLALERVTWQSPCDMLQKVSDYEAVHPIRNWTDLKRRVGPYRRCFVFTHSSMPREPIVVLHTALTDGISKSIQSIVAYPRMYSEADVFANANPMGEDPQKISTAVFYSITTSQKGLQGIELGNYLIKKVVKELQSEFPNITQFSSLSPIPGFHKWLLTELNKLEKGEDVSYSLFTPEELEQLQSHLDCTKENVYVRLKKSFVTNSWAQEDDFAKFLEDPAMRICARYLYLEKRRNYALDSVANFHLKNGAVMWRLNWKADQSPRGLGNSLGMMVNYRYFLEDTEDNSTTYLENYEIRASDQILNLAKLNATVNETPDSKI